MNSKHLDYQRNTGKLRVLKLNDTGFVMDIRNCFSASYIHLCKRDLNKPVSYYFLYPGLPHEVIFR
jgi:hypothetical protein